MSTDPGPLTDEELDALLDRTGQATHAKLGGIIDADAGLAQVKRAAGHEYCMACGAEALQRVRQESCPNPACYARGRRESGKEISSTHFYCRACGQCGERRVCLDPSLKMWTEADGTLWHESCGVFIRNPDGRFLFYQRTLYPAGSLTVPSGHIDAGERPEDAAARELGEEIRIKAVHIPARQIVPVASDDIVGDSCRLGSDAHRWHTFLAILSAPVEAEDVAATGEGRNPVLLTLNEALAQELAYPVKYVIERHAADLAGRPA